MKFISLFFLDILVFVEVLFFKTTLETELMECNLLFDEDNYVDQAFEEYINGSVSKYINKILKI